MAFQSADSAHQIKSMAFHEASKKINKAPKLTFILKTPFFCNSFAYSDYYTLIGVNCNPFSDFLFFDFYIVEVKIIFSVLLLCLSLLSQRFRHFFRLVFLVVFRFFLHFFSSQFFSFLFMFYINICVS